MAADGEASLRATQEVRIRTNPETDQTFSVGLGAPSGAAGGTCGALVGRCVVDAGYAQAHQPIFVEFPVLVAIAAKPAPAVIVPLAGEVRGNAIVAEGPFSP